MEDFNMNSEEGEIDLFGSKPMPISGLKTTGYTYYNCLESYDSSQESSLKLSMTPNRKNENKENGDKFLLNQPMSAVEEAKCKYEQVNVSDVCSLDSRSAGPQRGRPRSSSQPTENEKIIKDHFNSPKRRNKVKIETMSNNSHTKLKSGFSVDGCSVDGAIQKKRIFEKSYKPARIKERKLAKNNISRGYLHKDPRHKKRAFRIKNIDQVITKLNNITSEPMYVDLLYNTLRERNKSLLRSVVDELGMPACTQILREVALIQENGGMKVEKEGRYKTLGGVFFYLVRRSDVLSKQTKDRIFKPEKKYLKAKKNLVNDLEKLLTLGNE